jgi:hypothetical protein
LHSVGGPRLGADVVGYEVEGRDGHLGRIEQVRQDGAWALVATGRLRGRRYAVPAGLVRLVDVESEAILVDVGREELETSAEFEVARGFDETRERSLRSFYAALRAGRSR